MEKTDFKQIAERLAQLDDKSFLLIDCLINGFLAKEKLDRKTTQDTAV